MSRNNCQIPAIKLKQSKSQSLRTTRTYQPHTTTKQTHKLRRNNNSLSKHCRQFLFTKFQGWWNPSSMTRKDKSLKSSSMNCLPKNIWKSRISRMLYFHDQIILDRSAYPKFNFVKCNVMVLQWMIKRPRIFDYFFLQDKVMCTAPRQKLSSSVNWSIPEVFLKFWYQKYAPDKTCQKVFIKVSSGILNSFLVSKNTHMTK